MLKKVPVTAVQDLVVVLATVILLKAPLGQDQEEVCWDCVCTDRPPPNHYRRPMPTWLLHTLSGQRASWFCYSDAYSEPDWWSNRRFELHYRNHRCFGHCRCWRRSSASICP